jgi:hypothetical protein
MFKGLTLGEKAIIPAYLFFWSAGTYCFYEAMFGATDRKLAAQKRYLMYVAREQDREDKRWEAIQKQEDWKSSV